MRAAGSRRRTTTSSPGPGGLRAARRGPAGQAHPPGAGLGGGSADAAAVLRWAGCTDPALAAGLGADVPFCVAAAGPGSSGVGERVTAAPLRAAATTCCCCRPSAWTRRAVYRAWDDEPPAHDGPNELTAAALVTVEPRLARGATRCGNLAGREPGWPGAARPGSSRAARPRPAPRKRRQLRLSGRDGPAGPRAHRPGGVGGGLIGRRVLLAGPALPAGGLQHLLVLLLAHPLAALLDQ